MITYDVCTSDPAGQRRLRKVAECCRNYGRRVQNSVFECLISAAQFVMFKATILSLIDTKTDSIRIYNLGKNHAAKIEHLGKNTTYDIEGELIV
ncbi:MAG: CRISPR-associated endonuclease Cas2 [Bacteroidales bacterium]|nr:CRISPR-associated endonuclease Cas2 [Bacteroidales bacterium]